MTTLHTLLSAPSSVPRREREALLAHVVGRPREWLLAHSEAPVHPSRAARYRRLVRRLTHGEPIPHLLGEQWFYGRPFRVTRDVLIPRPETELMIELVLDRIRNQESRIKELTIVDLGTGSGCIAITLAKELSIRHSPFGFRIFATDSSPAALRVARTNARRNGVAHRTTFSFGDLLVPHSRTLTYFHDRRNTFGALFILANLPYLTTDEWRALPVSLKRYEPRAAFDGGPDGLKHFRELFKQLHTIAGGDGTPPLRPFGQMSSVSARGGSAFGGKCQVLLEIDPRRKRALAALVRQYLPTWEVSWHRDLAGRWRVLILERRTKGPKTENVN